MAKSFEEAIRAYERGEKSKAKQLSEAGKQYQAEMNRLNGEASQWVHEKLNPGDNDRLDLHGLYVKEAIERTEYAIRAAQKRGQRELLLIVGRGSHSEGQTARLKPAITQFIIDLHLNYSIDPGNDGVLLVQL
ncbi:hypothetical protein RSOLAG22IIIB_09970 [Rhizoctonia solani]|uniref:Smr domain-containing protein n=1 Tax=Rhizoctonia solani TaxID=456999 RepID=A0A0K6G0B1_9AGAM|nr:hypothetical protein RSOLAG22IIIB_09970 [Rhizoctonia solani]